MKGEISPVYVENGCNLAAVGESGFGTGHGKGCLVSLSIGPAPALESSSTASLIAADRMQPILI
ncbi:MAG: hypothetical protein WB586_28500 [Chthoniobacterales bacterium]